MDEYYILEDDAQKGPFALSQLQSMWRSGAITARTLYAQEGFAEWLPLSSLMHRLDSAPERLAPQPHAPVVAGTTITAAHQQILFESRKKSAAISAVLNLVLPGVGYMYCGQVGLGVVALIFVPIFVLFTFGYGAIITIPVMIIDGVMCAQRYNRALAEQLLGIAAASKDNGK